MVKILLRIIYVLNALIGIYTSVMMAQAVLSWVIPFTQPTNFLRKVYYWLTRITEPFIKLFRPLSNKLMSGRGIPIDLAFTFAVIALVIVQALLNGLSRFLMMMLYMA